MWNGSGREGGRLGGEGRAMCRGSWTAEKGKKEEKEEDGAA